MSSLFIYNFGEEYLQPSELQYINWGPGQLQSAPFPTLISSALIYSIIHTGDTGLRGPNGEAGIPGTKGNKGDQGDYKQ